MNKVFAMLSALLLSTTFTAGMEGDNNEDSRRENAENPAAQKLQLAKQTIKEFKTIKSQKVLAVAKDRQRKAQALYDETIRDTKFAASLKMTQDNVDVAYQSTKTMINALRDAARGSVGEDSEVKEIGIEQLLSGDKSKKTDYIKKLRLIAGALSGVEVGQKSLAVFQGPVAYNSKDGHAFAFVGATSASALDVILSASVINTDINGQRRKAADNVTLAIQISGLGNKVSSVWEGNAQSFLSAYPNDVATIYKDGLLLSLCGLQNIAVADGEGRGIIAEDLFSQTGRRIQFQISAGGGKKNELTLEMGPAKEEDPDANKYTLTAFPYGSLLEKIAMSMELARRTPDMFDGVLIELKDKMIADADQLEAKFEGLADVLKEYMQRVKDMTAKN